MLSDPSQTALLRSDFTGSVAVMVDVLAATPGMTTDTKVRHSRSAVAQPKAIFRLRIGSVRKDFSMHTPSAGTIRRWAGFLRHADLKRFEMEGALRFSVSLAPEP